MSLSDISIARLNEVHPAGIYDTISSMKSILLNRGFELKVDDEDFERVSKYHWFAFRSKNRVYVYRYLSPASRPLWQPIHRFILGVSSSRKIEVDHRDHDGLNNQKENLRKCTRSQNNANQRKQKRKLTSTFKGVCWCGQKNRWRATIKFDNKQIHLGFFKLEKDAAEAYRKAAVEIFGEFACVN